MLLLLHFNPHYSDYQMLFPHTFGFFAIGNYDL